MKAPGTHAHSVVELIDVFPTLAQLANVASPSYLGDADAEVQQHHKKDSYTLLPVDLDGQSLAGLVLGNPAAASSEKSKVTENSISSGTVDVLGNNEHRLLGAKSKNVAVSQWYGGAVPTTHNPLVNPCAVYAVRSRLIKGHS